jgi:hypothetical protein
MMKPQEIEDEEHEQVLERVAAIDVAKASGMVCTRVPHPSRPGKRRTRVWEAGATTGAVLELAEHLAGEGIEMVTLEATPVLSITTSVTPQRRSQSTSASTSRLVVPKLRTSCARRPALASDGTRIHASRAALPMSIPHTRSRYSAVRR